MNKIIIELKNNKTLEISKGEFINSLREFPNIVISLKGKNGDLLECFQISKEKIREILLK